MVLQSNNIIEVLENASSKAFIIRHLNDDIRRIALNKSLRNEENITYCLQLIEIYRKSVHKLPELTSLYPALSAKAYMQCSSERMAAYKASLIAGDSLLDLTAGLGIDSMAFSKRFKYVRAVENDPDLHQMALYNLKLAGIKNVERVCASAEDEIKGRYDWVYLDPDRRVNNQRAVALHRLKPSVPELLKRISAISRYCMIKLSPLFEVKEVEKQIPYGTEIRVISEQNEVKEILLLIDFQKRGENKTMAIDLAGDRFEYTAEDAETCEVQTKFAHDSFLYFPLHALIKAHLDESCMAQYRMKKHEDFAIYFSEESKSIREAKGYRIDAQLKPSVKLLKREMKNRGIRRINIMVKGEKSAKWREKLNIVEGGDAMLIILLGKNKQAFLCSPML